MYRQGLEKIFELTQKGYLGEAADCDPEVKVLYGVIRLDERGLRYEADPRHAELLVLVGGPGVGNEASSPGEKPTDTDYDAILEEAVLDDVEPGQLDGELSSPVLPFIHTPLVHYHGKSKSGIIKVPGSTTMRRATSMNVSFSSAKPDA